nr:flagellar basal body-associated FliL family protein [uncultured Tolumonas sp.]
MNKKAILISVIGGLLLILFSVGATLLVIGHPDWYGAAAHNEQPTMPEVSKKPLFKPLEKFVISIDGDASRHYLMLEMTLVTHSASQIESYDELMPVIRNSLVQYFSQRNEAQLTEELHHVEHLQTELQERLISTLQNYGFKAALDEVLITKYVVQ